MLIKTVWQAKATARAYLEALVTLWLRFLYITLQKDLIQRGVFGPAANQDKSVMINNACSEKKKKKVSKKCSVQPPALEWNGREAIYLKNVKYLEGNKDEITSAQRGNVWLFCLAVKSFLGGWAWGGMIHGLDIKNDYILLKASYSLYADFC